MVITAKMRPPRNFQLTYAFIAKAHLDDEFSGWYLITPVETQ